jgi:hypothetical protein
LGGLSGLAAPKYIFVENPRFSRTILVPQLSPRDEKSKKQEIVQWQKDWI